jgi:hypothetical protein
MTAGDAVRPEPRNSEPGAEENSQPIAAENAATSSPISPPADARPQESPEGSAQTVQAPGRSVVDEAIYRQARELVERTRLVSPAMLSKKLGVAHEEAVDLIYRLIGDRVITRDDQGRLRVPKAAAPAEVQAATEAATVQAPGQTAAAAEEKAAGAPAEETPAPASGDEVPQPPAPQGWQVVEPDEQADPYQQVRAIWKRKGQRAGRLYINTAAHDLLSEVYGVVTGHKNVRFNGIHAGAENVIKMASAAMLLHKRSEGSRAQAFELLAKVLRQAANDEVQVVTVNHWDKPSMAMRGTIRHEEMHRAQRLLERATQKMPAAEGMESLPHIRAVRDGLVKRGYNNDLTVVTLEAAAHMAAGEESFIGITREQAIEFMHGFFQLWKETYGEHALKEFTHLTQTYKEVRDHVRRPEEPSAARTADGDVQEVAGATHTGEEEAGVGDGHQPQPAAEASEEEDPDVIEARAIQEQLRKEREGKTGQEKTRDQTAEHNGKYYVVSMRSDGQREWKEVKGKPVSVPSHPDVELFIHRSITKKNDWVVSEVRTGSGVTLGYLTRDAAMAAAKKNLDEQGARMRGAMRTILEEGERNLSPRFRQGDTSIEPREQQPAPKASQQQYRPGQLVRITTGEMAGRQFRIEKINDQGTLIGAEANGNVISAKPDEVEPGQPETIREQQKKKTTKPRAPKAKQAEARRRSAPAPTVSSGKVTTKPAIEADDEINGLLDQLQKIKGRGADMSLLVDFSTTEEPALDELVVMVKLMRAYAQRGVTDFSDAVKLFQQHYASRGNPRQFDRALEIGWERLSGKAENKGKLSAPGRVIDILSDAAQTTNEGEPNGELEDTGESPSTDERPEGAPADGGERDAGGVGDEGSGAGKERVRQPRSKRDAATRSPDRGDETTGDGEQSDRPTAGEDTARPGRGKSNRSDAPHAETETAATSNNFRITNPEALAQEGIKTKFRNNVEAIELINQLRAEGRLRLATPSEQQTLSRYTGWGAMSGAFNTYGAESQTWAKERDRMSQLLADGLISKEEYDSMKRSTINAHYTSAQVVGAIWRMVSRLGFKGGTILEPATGIGNFFGLMPPEIHGQSKLSGVEKEKLAGDMATALYPRAYVQVTPFEKAVLPDNFYDLIISNVPFAKDVKILADRKYRGLQPDLHDYFFLKSLDKARPGGIVAFITSMTTMDRQETKIRAALQERADLVAAIRLPGDAFHKNAGTDITTDLVILRKRAKGEEASGPDWLETAEVADPDGGKPIVVNRYFAEHPEQILGQLDRRGKIGAGLTKNVTRTADYEARLEAAINRLPENLYRQAGEQKAFEPQRLEAPGEVKDSGYQVRDGRLFQRDGGELIEREAGKTLVRRIEGHLIVRDALREVFNAQLEGKSDETQAETRAKLTRALRRLCKEEWVSA